MQCYNFAENQIFDPNFHSFTKTHISHSVVPRKLRCLHESLTISSSETMSKIHYTPFQKVSIISWSKHLVFFFSYFNFELPSSSVEIQIECRENVYLFNTLNKMKRVYTWLFVLLHSFRAHQKYVPLASNEAHVNMQHKSASDTHRSLANGRKNVKNIIKIWTEILLWYLLLLRKQS